MSEATIIFPHQLFKQNPAIATGRKCYLVEETLFFSQYLFHQQKLVLHRASMKAYADFLSAKKMDVDYINATEDVSDIRKLIALLSSQNVTIIHFSDPVDEWLNKRIAKACSKYPISMSVYQPPCFLNTMAEANDYFGEKSSYFQTSFYIDQRKRRGILLNSPGQPAGGKWSFDADNRLKFPKNEKAPVISFPIDNVHVSEAKKYIHQHFAKHYGDISSFRYPVDFAGAEKWLDDFIETRFEKFGIYEDAIVAKEHYLHHSVLSPLLNIGLLTPQQVIDKAIGASKKYNIPLNSLEGFTRQIIGWREFIRIVYERKGNRQRTTNFWGFSRKIPPSFWNGTTRIAPIDQTIKKILATGYCHHIERLMILGNFMLLCEFDPGEVYKWFMELFIDSYDWVMVPNVYGMTQFADGGLMTTKPYISGSNYILKMSDYKKGDWCGIWDALFWRFMVVNRDVFSANQRMGMLLKTWDKMGIEKQDEHLVTAEKYLDNL